MQFKYKIQQYQADAADAVTGVFLGQPKQDPLVYLRDRGRVQIAAGMEQIEGIAEQLESAEGYANSPVRLSKDELLRNIRQIQRSNQIVESQELFDDMGACHLDVEMETGTGKTYVYTKTMFELNKLYGWTKFIIVVPSVAIREGVKKSLDSTQQHFKDQYGKTAYSFIYDSDNLTELDGFSQSPDINVMIINMQAFNASMKEGAKNKAARIIFDERDEFRSRRPIDVIAANRPIVILDEPQKMGKANSATQKGIARFNPLFVLGYSATHKIKHNTVYVLDALDAYNQRLVKAIEVKGFTLKNRRGTDGYLYLRDIVVSKTKAPEAVIEFEMMGESGRVRKVTKRFREGDDIYLETGKTRKLSAYQGYVIASGDGIVPPQEERQGYVRFLNNEKIFIGEVYHDSAREDMQRIQIRETIKSHLQKEGALFHRGIKCLSLFFIDAVAKYRDLSGEGETVGYGKVFEEEYEAAVAERLANLTTEDAYDPSYIAYLRRDSAHAVHDGYFSIDKKNRVVECAAEKKADIENGIGLNDDDAKRGYDLILRDKERLLSFDEPVRFIFSHSALREGWDNPNIFQICTLKESGSDVSKRQEVGRGLRLCVDQNGDRQDAQLLDEDEVQRVNNLTVIASESYEDFVKGLQSDIEKTLRERPSKVGVGFFSGMNIEVGGVSIEYDSSDSRALYRFLIKNDYIDEEDRPSEKFMSEAAEGIFVSRAVAELPEKFQAPEHARAIEALLKSVHNPHALDGMIRRAEERVTENSLTDNYRREEFQELWRRINRKHAYTVSFSDEELRSKAVQRLNADLRVSRLQYTLTEGEQRAVASREELRAGRSFEEKHRVTRDVRNPAAVTVRYDLVGDVAKAAAISRRSSAIILSGIAPAVFAQYRINPEEFIKRAAALIVEVKASMVVEHVAYHEIDDWYDSTIFTARMPDRASAAYEAKKNVQRFVFPDSDGERKLAEDMDVADEVVVYAKLPRAFQIPTPVGDYAPDWAIAFKKGSVKHIFFVAETKGTMDTFELSGVEQAKIACAKKLFNEMSTSEVRYHQIATHDDLLKVMGSID